MYLAQIVGANFDEQMKYRQKDIARQSFIGLGCGIPAPVGA